MKYNVYKVFNVQVMWICICFLLLFILGILLAKKDSLEKDTTRKYEQSESCLHSIFRDSSCHNDQISQFFTPSSTKVQPINRNSNSTIDSNDESLSSRVLMRKSPNTTIASAAKNIEFNMNSFRSFLKVYISANYPVLSYINWYSNTSSRMGRVIHHFTKLCLMLTVTTLYYPEQFKHTWKLIGIIENSTIAIAVIYAVYASVVGVLLTYWYKIRKENIRNKSLDESISDKIVGIIPRYQTISQRIMKKVHPFENFKDKSNAKQMSQHLLYFLYIAITIIGFAISIKSAVVLCDRIDKEVNLALVVVIGMILLVEYCIAPIIGALLMYIIVRVSNGRHCFHITEGLLRYNNITLC